MWPVTLFICLFSVCLQQIYDWIICDAFCVLVGDFSTSWHQFFLLLSECMTVFCTVDSITPFSVTLFLSIVWLFHSLTSFSCTDIASQIFSFCRYLQDIALNTHIHSHIFVCMCMPGHMCMRIHDKFQKRIHWRGHEWQFNPRQIPEELSQCLTSIWVVIFSYLVFS